MCNVADLSFMKTIFPSLVMSLQGNQIAILSQNDKKNMSKTKYFRLNLSYPVRSES